MKSPLVTIVTVTYNCAEEVEATIQSVLSQDYPNIEYIVVDGASTDGTLDVVKKYDSQITKWISEPDGGVYFAMNKAIKMATGSWIVFMNAGDRFYSNDVVSVIFSNEEHYINKKVIYGLTQYLEENGSSHLHQTSKISDLKNIICKYQPYCHQSVFYNITDKNDCLYNTNYRIAADYDVACRYWNKYGLKSYTFVDKCVSIYKAYDGISSSPSRKRKAFAEKIKVKIRNGMSPFEIAKDLYRFIFH